MLTAKLSLPAAPLLFVDLTVALVLRGGGGGGGGVGGHRGGGRHGHPGGTTGSALVIMRIWLIGFRLLVCVVWNWDCDFVVCKKNIERMRRRIVQTRVIVI